MWEESLRAYHRLVELKGKFLDVDILAVLVCAITEGNPLKDIPPGTYILIDILAGIIIRGYPTISGHTTVVGT